jgi:hypothetical protein
MRLASFVLLLAVPATACSEPDSRIEPAQVSWMEWPAEVSVATPFSARLVGFGVSCVQVVRFVTAPTVDESAVTFEPYFLVTGRSQFCPLDGTRQSDVRPQGLSIIAPYFDAQATVPGLDAEYPRTYEIRAGTSVFVPGTLDARLPIRTFGDITVRTAQVENGHINAAGTAYASRDSLGCVSLHPFGVYPGYVIENAPADTTQYWSAFVRGYIYDAPAPVCGESKVFHLVTRE